MDIRLKFLGAAQNVTGSRYLLQADGTKVLIDCGLYQERHMRQRNWDPFPESPESIDAILLTHAHLDHCGWLPKLFAEGFHGRIYATPATAEIAKIVLLDSAHIQEEDAFYKRKRHQKEGRRPPHPEVPLYTQDDAQACSNLFSTVGYKKPQQIGNGIRATFHNAGHILGASMIKVEVGVNGQTRTIIFSGDIGQWDVPILRDPTIFEQADYVLTESTYGDRLHPDTDNIKELLAEVVNTTHAKGGNIVIPSFALERSQEVLYRLNELLLEKKIPQLPVFMDSPMAINVTEVFQKHSELFDEEMVEFMRNHESPFDFPGLTMTRSTSESKQIQHHKGPCIIIAGSGMCTGGRVKHHLVSNISRPQSTVLIVGYQAVGTLGRLIVEGVKEVRIHGQRYAVEARIAQIQGFSAHADRDGLLKWLTGLKAAPRHVFAVHGESETLASFTSFLKDKTGWSVSAPNYLDEVVLD
ncbi:MAG: MBL fold metallo-hydrolase [Actinobacteria bacterium]|nr:MBL fold metallo-hydrolase [Actinomycetota bacterium]